MVVLVQKRIILLLVGLLLSFVVITGRIAWVQFVDGKQMVERIQFQLVDKWKLQSPRGTIYDRNGKELAVSRMTKSLYANPSHLNPDPDTVAAWLAPVLDLKQAVIKARLEQGGSFVWLKRMLEPEKSQAVTAIIKEHQIKGLAFIEESKRYYPNDGLAAQTLGFVGTDDVGLDGIERALDKVIKGKQTEQAVETDSYGTPIFKSIFSYTPRKEGKSVYLTLDLGIQFVVEQNLDKIMATTHARSATVIIMNPRTGEILAIGNRPGYNPNEFYRYNEKDWKNRAVSFIYEPGSTFKTVVAAAAVQENLIRPEDRFYDKGFVEVSGRRIQNWNGESYGNISFLKVFEDSINTGFVHIGLKLGAARLNHYAEMFGFGQTTGSGLPGEENGILFKTEDMRASDVATMAIGQSIACTPLQLLTAVSAIANDGVLLKPYIVKEIDNADGTVESRTTTQVVRQAVSPEAAHIVKYMMEKEMEEGGGKAGTVKGYLFGGKTGTAQRLNDNGSGYEAGHYISSFVGFGPVENPQVAALVVIDDPQGGLFYGSEIAAPAFRDIMTQVVRLLNIPPDNPQTLPAPETDQPVPAAPAAAAIPAESPPPGKAVVPNLAGTTIREAGELLNKAGLAFVPQGTGVMVRQSMPPGTVVQAGTEVTVYFEPR
ncbi:Hypothetical protein LUCI_0522 [Lucifera butyrica]|uniref:PASTA domain-containing protein n=1 Tax=Lucifera butyrica TaxID=1351585 RepID=A0A498R2D8_9FIRM|nr:penicillin-binding transpeptidase domain-containing protein [Lucifera butyrica]VBB05315.1 Hypothetical protein LUCI_0522 [Lucifera butyrica]